MYLYQSESLKKALVSGLLCENGIINFLVSFGFHGIGEIYY